MCLGAAGQCFGGVHGHCTAATLGGGAVGCGMHGVYIVSTRHPPTDPGRLLTPCSATEHRLIYNNKSIVLEYLYSGT